MADGDKFPRTCLFYDRRRRLRCTECAELFDLCKCTDDEIDDKAQNRLLTPEGQLLSAVWREFWSLKETEHVPVQIIADLGRVLEKFVQNNRDKSVPDSEIRLDLLKLMAKLLLLTAHGTPEYAYPSQEG